MTRYQAWVAKLEGDHARSRSRQRVRQRTGARADIDDEIAGLDAGVANEFR